MNVRELRPPVLTAGRHAQKGPPQRLELETRRPSRGAGRGQQVLAGVALRPSYVGRRNRTDVVVPAQTLGRLLDHLTEATSDRVTHSVAECCGGAEQV